jgi:hypothetical protein
MMTARRLDDELIDPAEAEMPEAAFAIIEHVHQLCGHPAAVEFEAAKRTHVSDLKLLEQHAIKILSAQIRAGQLVRSMKQRGDFDLEVSDLVETKSKKFLDLSALVETDCEGSHCCEPSLVDDETDTDWAEVAQNAWHDESWKVAAANYHRTRRGVRQ